MKYLEITLACNGRVLQMGRDADGVFRPIGITAVEGLESSDLEVSTADNALVDGSDVEGKRILARPVHIEAQARDSSISRQDLIRFFNPKYTGLMTVSNCGTVRKINYELEGWAMAKNRVHGSMAFTVDLICPDPYFMDMDDYGKNLAEVTRQLAFPWNVVRAKMPAPVPYNALTLPGQITGYRRLNKQVALANGGDVPTSFRVQFLASRGEVKNPQIALVGTGKYVRVVTDMVQHDMLLVDTGNRSQAIELNGINIYNRIDRLSEPFQLEPGENVLEYDADEGYMNLDVRLFYTPMYLGV